MEEQVWSLKKHQMKNSYNNKYFNWLEKKLNNKNISFSIQICFE